MLIQRKLNILKKWLICSEKKKLSHTKGTITFIQKPQMKKLSICTLKIKYEMIDLTFVNIKIISLSFLGRIYWNSFYKLMISNMPSSEVTSFESYQDINLSFYYVLLSNFLWWYYFSHYIVFDLTSHYFYKSLHTDCIYEDSSVINE